MPETKPSLQLELQSIARGLGAVLGALLRWQVALHLGDQNLLVNVLGLPCWVCWPGSCRATASVVAGHWLLRIVTTFSSWMLAAMKHLSDGDWAAVLGLIGLTPGWGSGLQGLASGAGAA